MSKRLLPILLLVLVVIFTGCGSSFSQNNIVTDEDGNMLSYSLGEIAGNSKYNGFYVMNKNKTFSPVFTGMSGYEEPGSLFKGSTDFAKRYLWFCDTEEVKHEKLIPVVTKDTPLIGVFDAEDGMPTSYFIEKYNPSGYTLGCLFSMNEDQTSIILGTDTLCPNSSIDAFLSSNKLSGNYELGTFNRSKEIPVTNLHTPTGLLLGLEKGKRYQIGLYEGTSYINSDNSQIILRADTRVFLSEGATELVIPFKKTTDSYFVVNLPDNITDGFYYICGAGMFEYRSQ